MRVHEVTLQHFVPVCGMFYGFGFMRSVRIEKIPDIEHFYGANVGICGLATNIYHQRISVAASYINRRTHLTYLHTHKNVTFGWLTFISSPNVTSSFTEGIFHAVSVKKGKG